MAIRVLATINFSFKAPISQMPLDLPAYPKVGQTFSIMEHRKFYDCANSAELTNYRNPEFYEKRFFEIVKVYYPDISSNPPEIDCYEICADNHTNSQN